jgi:hypothetical protein
VAPPTLVEPVAAGCEVVGLTLVAEEMTPELARVVATVEVDGLGVVEELTRVEAVVGRTVLTLVDRAMLVLVVRVVGDTTALLPAMVVVGLPK